MTQSIFYFILVLAFLSLSPSISKGQDSIAVRELNQKVKGIPISKTDFDKKISFYLKKMSDWNQFNANQYIEMVRLYNTVGRDLPIKSDFYKMYYTVFLVMYSKKAAQELGAKFSKGMAMYSIKHNIWIGDEPLGNENSIFKIDTAN